MDRRPNTDRTGNIWTGTIVDQVWAKARQIPNYPPDIWRWDLCGKVMKKTDFGNTNSNHGWEIDHINPVSGGGSDEISNLQPLQWNNNRSKGDRADWKCGQ